MVPMNDMANRRLGNVLPRLAPDYLAYPRLVDAVAPGECRLGRAISDRATNGADVLGAQFGTGNLLTSRATLRVLAWPPPCAPLGVAVGVIGGPIAEPEMLNVDAGRVVPAGAIVEDTMSIGDRPMRENPSHAMRLLVPPEPPDDPVSLVGKVPRKDAASRLRIIYHARPEPRGRFGLACLIGATPRTATLLLAPRTEGLVAVGADGGILGGHHNLQCCGVTPRGVTSTASASCFPHYSTETRPYQGVA